jgi:hypothetical protein
MGNSATIETLNVFCVTSSENIIVKKVEIASDLLDLHLCEKQIDFNVIEFELSDWHKSFFDFGHISHISVISKNRSENTEEMLVTFDVLRCHTQNIYI